MSNSIPKTMTAWRQNAYGGPESLTRAEVPVPQPGEGEVLIKIGATSLNGADVRIMRGDPKLVRLGSGMRGPKEKIRGKDVAGTIVAVGPRVFGRSVGDRVVGELPGGGLAEFVVAYSSKLSTIPSGVNDKIAATLPLAGGTAWQALESVNTDRGASVLVIGAGGGVGTFTVNLATWAGAHVHALCSPRAIETVTALGAERVDDRTTTSTESLASDDYDVIVDLGGVVPLRELRRLVRDGGDVVEVAVGGNSVVGPLGRAIGSQAMSTWSKKHLRPLLATKRPGLTKTLLELAASGEVTPHIDREFPLDSADQALKTLDDGGVVGKILVVPGS